MLLQDILLINVAVLIRSMIIYMINNNQFSIGDLLWEQEKYWQVQLFTTLYGMNIINDLYSMKRKSYQK